VGVRRVRVVSRFRSGRLVAGVAEPDFNYATSRSRSFGGRKKTTQGSEARNKRQQRRGNDFRDTTFWFSRSEIYGVAEIPRRVPSAQEAAQVYLAWQLLLVLMRCDVLLMHLVRKHDEETFFSVSSTNGRACSRTSYRRLRRTIYNTSLCFGISRGRSDWRWIGYIIHKFIF